MSPEDRNTDRRTPDPLRKAADDGPELPELLRDVGPLLGADSLP
ncbi:hypothetical protein [Streptomyces sp. AV19]|nr:hypothetical protein [Streptomyces sp. AV19]MDG4536349.1 hypothetical protein [Streptomyces sp. AV19]